MEARLTIAGDDLREDPSPRKNQPERLSRRHQEHEQRAIAGHPGAAHPSDGLGTRHHDEEVANEANEHQWHERRPQARAELMPDLDHVNARRAHGA
ncbi:MAG TPA: hypothetical protein VGC79_30620, partial [Polyangiaceae bacterium]